MSDGLVGPLLLGYGLAGLVGNPLTASVAGRAPRRTLAPLGAGLTAALPASPSPG